MNEKAIEAALRKQFNSRLHGPEGGALIFENELPKMAKEIAAALPTGQEWRDIRSAPKDGTPVDLWRVSRDGKVNYTVPCREACARWDRTHARWHCDSCYSRESDFTHWQPLPAPPVAEPLPAGVDHEPEYLKQRREHPDE